MCNVDMVKKEILDLNPNFTSSEITTRTNDVFKNVRAHKGIDPKDDNIINLLPLSIGNNKDRITYKIINELRRREDKIVYMMGYMITVQQIEGNIFFHIR